MADIDRIAGRPRAYLAGTGVLPLSGGLVFFFLGVSALVQSRLMRKPEYQVYGLVAQYAGLCSMGAVLWGVAVIKRRMVFPRGGYVELARPKRQFGVAFVAIGVLAFLTSLWPGARVYVDSPLIAPLFAIVFAILCLWSSRKERHSGTLAFGLYLLCVAPLLWWVPANAYERMSLLAVAVGVPMAITGALRLRRYLKANPLGAETPNE